MRASNDSTLFQKAIVKSNKFGMCITRATWKYETAFWRCNKQHRSYFVPFLQSFVHNWPFVFMPFSLYLLLWASRHDYFAIVLVSVVIVHVFVLSLRKREGEKLYLNYLDVQSKIAFFYAQNIKRIAKT